MLFKRYITDKLFNLLSTHEAHPNVILIEGPRQVGKTTVVWECLKEHQLPYLSINLEKDPPIKMALDRCQSFAEFTQWLFDEFQFKPDGSKILFIDEAQESLKLGSFVRFMKEDWVQTKVILTGSMMVRLFRNDTRYPVGRVTTLRVQPFSFFEYLRAIQKEEWVKLLELGNLDAITPARHESLLNELDNYIKIGGLPPVLLDAIQKLETKKSQRNIFENYKNDFMRVFGEDQGFMFEKAMQAVADHVGSPSKLTQALPANDTAYKNMAAVFSRLESWHMVYTCQQRGPQPEGSTQFHPKRYLFDLGILSYLRTLGVPNINILKTREAMHRQALGGIFENLVAFYMEHWDLRLTGWKKSSAGSEIDFILLMNETTYPLECKASLKTKDTHLLGLKNYMKEYGIKTALLVNAAPFSKRDFPLGRIISIPLYALEALPAILKKHTA